MLVQVSDGGIAVTDYSVSVDSLLVGDSPPTNPIILRMPGHVSNKTGAITSISFVLPTPGDQFLFALGRNPDGTYGSGPEGLLDVSGETVAFAEGVPFEPWTSPNQLGSSRRFQKGPPYRTPPIGRGPGR